jgi:uncharacterized protein YjbI with pentapeptide repeats
LIEIRHRESGKALLCVNATRLAGARLDGADLTDAELTGTSLAGGCLREAILLRANLARADLSQCDLTFATLAGANLEGANLEGADLAHAHLEAPDGVIETHPAYYLSPAYGETARLASVRCRDGERVARILQEASVPAAVTGHLGWHFDVSEEDHERAYKILERDAKERGYPIWLSGRSVSEEAAREPVTTQIGSFEPIGEKPLVTNLKRACLRGANLVDAFLDFANLAGSDLRHAKLAGQILECTNLQRASLAQADLCSAVLGCNDMRGADLQAADMRGAILAAAYSYDRGPREWGRGQFRMSMQLKANRQARTGTQLQGADLQAADLRGAALWGADLSGANLRGADFREADFAGTNLSEDQWAQMREWLGADVPRTNLAGADLAGVDLRGACYGSDTCWPQGFDPVQHGAVLVR